MLNELSDRLDKLYKQKYSKKRVPKEKVVKPKKEPKVKDEQLEKEKNCQYQQKWYRENKDKKKEYQNEYRRRKVEELRKQGCINAWSVVNEKKQPKFKE